LEPLLPQHRKSTRANDRRVLNGIFYVLRTDMPWRDLPGRYAPYSTAYILFNCQGSKPNTRCLVSLPLPSRFQTLGTLGSSSEIDPKRTWPKR
jgi:transposase